MKKIINVKPKTKLVENSLKVGDKDYAVKLRRRVTDLSRALELAKKALQKAEANNQLDVAEQLRARIQELEDLLANYNVDTIDSNHSPIDSESEGKENDKPKDNASEEEEQEAAKKAEDEESEDEDPDELDPDELDPNQIPPPEPEPEENQEEPKAGEKGEGNNKDSKNKDKSNKDGDPGDDNDRDGEDGEQEDSNNGKQNQNGKQKDKQDEGDGEESEGGESEDESDDDDASNNDKSKGGKNKENTEDESEDDSIDNDGDGEPANDESDDQQKGNGKSKKDPDSEDDTDDESESEGGGGDDDDTLDDNSSNKDKSKGGSKSDNKQDPDDNDDNSEGSGESDDNSSEDNQDKNKSKGGSSSNKQDPNNEEDSDSEGGGDEGDESEDSEDQNGNGQSKNQSSQKQPNKSQQNSDEKNKSKSQSKPTLDQEEDDEDGGGESEFQNPFADDDDISSNGGLPMGGKPPRQATKDETIELLGTLTGEGKEGAIDALKELIAKRKAATPVESFKPLGGQTLTEAVKSVRDMTDDEFGDYINDTYDLIDKAEKVDYVDDIEDRKKKISDWSQDPTVIQDLYGEDSFERQKDYQKKKARDAAKAKYSAHASLDDFKMDFYSAIHNQIEMVRQEILSYDEINAEYESEGIIMKAEVMKELPSDAKPIIDVYFDVSGSWDEKDIEIGESAIASVKIFEDQGDIVMNIFYFSEGVDNVSMQHCRDTYGTGTYAWPEILQNIKATGAKNVLIMTDRDFERLSSWNDPASPKMNGSLTVDGCVWYLWKNGESSPSCLPKLKGYQGTYQYSFRG